MFECNDPPKKETCNVFVYGTLMFDRTFRAVTGFEGSYCGVTATLEGYERRAVCGAGYPAIFQNEVKSVQGILLKDLYNTILHSLDRYEGEGRLYNRRQVTVTDDDTGNTHEAYTYVWGHGPNSLANSDWEHGVEVFGK